jgi:hypothetical protein
MNELQQREATSQLNPLKTWGSLRIRHRVG